ncbi:MAG TPA: hypothetical protein VJS15_06350 [Allosphingosinicella sp.]|nr:hypothetical protein [Allosphingosinicella sp.]
MTTKTRRGAGESAPSAPDFDPVSLRYRRDGWTPERQVAFIRALAECGCVRDACRRVGMSPESAYELARRPDAQSFRIAWDVAMDNAVRRIGDEAFSRCIHGVAVPHYYQGQLIGEHRRYDERLTMFILRYRDPARYGRHLDGCGYDGIPEEKALDLADVLTWVEADARREAVGLPRRVRSEFAADNDEGAEAGPLRSRTNIYRWAPKPAHAGAGWDDSLEDDDPCPGGDGEAAISPDAASGSSTSGEATSGPSGHSAPTTASAASPIARPAATSEG